MINRKEGLSTKSNESIMKAKYVRCWNCHLNGFDILDIFGCCKRCKTNITKYPSREKHLKPDLSDERVAREVLGSREKFTVNDDNSQDGW